MLDLANLLELEALTVLTETVGDGTDPAPVHPDATRIDALLLDAMAEGGAVLLALARDAVRRAVNNPAGQSLFNDAELEVLADTFAAVLAQADGLGRQIIRDAAERVTEALEPGATSSAPPPRGSLSYFRGLAPAMGTDPMRAGPDLRRRAFTLAVATNTQLLGTVQKEIARRLESGEAAGGPQAVQGILDAAGVSLRNPQYAEMVYRTNAMDAYNQASQEELTATADVFPVWMYSNPHDSRSRPEHKERDGKYYPSTVPFTQVRGTEAGDVVNCRCTMIPITRRKWVKLRDQGARIADGYGDPLEAPAPAAAPAKPAAARWTEVPDVRTAKRVQKVLGQPATPETLLPMAGGLPGAKVMVISDAPDRLILGANGPNYMTAVSLVRDGDELVARLTDINVRGQQQGTGTKMLATMADALQKAGAKELRADAVRSKEDVGYYVWPRLGFDGPIPAGLELPLPLQSARTLRELFALPGGAAWWRENGVRVEVVFDLRPDSQSWAILRQRLGTRRL